MDTCEKRKIPVIIDTDPGVDDVLALKAAFSGGRLDVKLVCSVAGNVNIENTTANALFFTRKFGGDIPVAKGFSSPLALKSVDASEVHGKSGVGKYTVPQHAYSLCGSDAVQAMYETLVSAEEKLTVIALGPLTNVAKLLEVHPEVKERIESVYSMSSSVDGTGNITEYAEFNAYCDPEALSAVVDSGISVVFAPMHLGRDAKLSQKDILSRGEGSEFGQILSVIFEGYRDAAAGDGYVAMYDANAVEALMHPHLYRFVRCEAEVNTKERPGQTFLRESENGGCFYLEIEDRDALSESMLDDIFC